MFVRFRFRGPYDVGVGDLRGPLKHPHLEEIAPGAIRRGLRGQHLRMDVRVHGDEPRLVSRERGQRGEGLPAPARRVRGGEIDVGIGLIHQDERPPS